MRKRIYVFAFLVLLINACIAGIVSREKASAVAFNWAKLNGHNQLSISSIDTVRTTLSSNLYLVSYKPQGYAIVSMHDFTRPILSWSFKSSIFVDEMPDAYQVILDEYNNQITELLKIHFKGEEIDLQQWNTLSNNAEVEDIYENQRTALNLTARWKQTTPYNNQCTYGGVYYPVGCGQTALGQIMHYWSYPLVGSGYNSYSNTSPSFPLQANFGLTRYDWYNMPNSITTSSPQVQIDAISQLLFHCGVASNAQYATGGTSSSTSDSRNALVSYFRYNPAAEIKNKTWLVSWNTWHGWITGEIDGNRPVFYRGDNSVGVGHAYVVYGYQYVSGEPAYLINLGFAQSSDTYWFVSGTTSGGYTTIGYSYAQAAIINIAPLNTQQTLYVESSNPSSGVVITGTGTDLMGYSAGGTTPYERYYNSGASITLTAPQISSNKRFVKWTKNDVDYSTSLSINAPLPTNMHLGSAYYKAVYGTPTLNTSPTSLSFGDILINTYSGPQTYTLSGSNLIANVTVTAPSRYQVSLSSSSGFGSSLTVTPTNGNVNTTIYVRFNPNATGAVTGNVTNTSNGATSRNVAVSGTGVEPTISVSPSSLSFGNINVNTYSSPLSYSLTGSNLTSNVTVTAPTRYQVSLSSGSGYGSSLNITPSGGSVSRTIYVRFNPNATGTATGNVTNVSSGATTRNVSVTGTGVSPTPDVDVSPSTLSFGNQIINTSAILSYELTGSYLTANVSVTAPSGYTVSTSQNGTYSSTLTVTQSGGQVDQTIWVKFTPTQSIGYTGNVSNASSGASTANVAVSGTGFIQGPLINVVPNSLSFGNQIINTSATQSYLLTGSYLTANVTVTAPTGFAVSTSQSGTYSSTITVTQSGGNVNQTVWVKFTPTQTITYTGNVSNASSGATTANVAVTGTGINPGPYINVNPGSLSFGNQLIDTSTSQSYQLTASSLTTDVTVSAPAGYTVSTSQGGTYSSTLTVSQIGGSVDQVVWVKFTPTQSISYPGEVSNASSGASTVNVAVAGTGVENMNFSYLDFGQFNTYLPAGQTYPGRYNFPTGIPNNKAFNILYSQSGPYPTSILKYHVIDSELVSSSTQQVFADAPNNMTSPAIHSNSSSVYIAGLYNSGGRDPLHFNKYNIVTESMTNVSSNSSWPTGAFSDIIPLDILKSANGSIYVIHSWRYVSWSIPEDDLYMRYSNDEMLTWGPWVQGEHIDGVGIIYDAMMVEGTDNSIHIALWVDWGGAHKSVYFKYSTLTNSFVQRSVIGNGKNACLFIDNATGNICMTYLDVQGQLVARTSNVSDTNIWSTEQIVFQQSGGTWGTSNSVSNSQYDQERFWYQWTSPASRHIIEWDGTSNWYDHGEITTTMPSNVFDSSKIYRLQNGDLHIVQGYKDSVTDIYYTHLERILASQIPDPFGIPGSLDPPQNMSISCNSSATSISWDPVLNATSYKVYSSTDAYDLFAEDLSGTFAGCSWTSPIGESCKFYYVTAVAASTSYQACDFPPILLGEWYDDPNNVWNISIRNIPPYRIRTGNIYYWPQTTHFNGNRYRVLALRDGTSEEHTFFFENVTATTMDANQTLGNAWEPIGGFTGHHKN